MVGNQNVGFYSRQHYAEGVDEEIKDLDDFVDPSEEGQVNKIQDCQDKDQEKESDLVQVQHKKTLLMMMMCKDDKLLLQMGGLLHIVTQNASNFLTEEQIA